MDALEQLILGHPFETANFFCLALSVGFSTGLLLNVPTVFVLYSSFTDGSSSACESTLRVWFVVRILVFVSQIPFRYRLYRQFGKAVANGDRHQAVDELLRLYRSNTFRINQRIGLFLYMWFFLALILLIYGRRHCGGNTLLPILFANIVICIVHMTISMYWMHKMLANNALYRAARRTGASDQVINACTKLVPFGTDTTSNDCDICFDDYAPGILVRVLPCLHDYHAKCIDKWLAKKKACPLCDHDIDEPIPEQSETVSETESVHQEQPRRKVDLRQRNVVVQ